MVAFTDKVIGILGGMGPEATAKLYLEIIRIFQERYNAKYDSDFPEILIYNLPLPDVVESQSDVKKILCGAYEKLISFGSDFVVVPCNTADGILRSCNAKKLVSIIEETAKYFASKPYKKIGLLSTKLTVKTRAYQKALKKFGIALVLPSESEAKIITKIIMCILSGEKNKNDARALEKIISRMRSAGAQAIILGCTELPLLLTQTKSNFELVNTINVLAEATVRVYRGEKDESF